MTDRIDSSGEDQATDARPTPVIVPAVPEPVTSPLLGRCVARRTNGEWCRLYPINGGTVCRVHGGSAPQVKAAAQRRLAQAKAAKALAHVVVDDIENPIEALATLTAKVVALSGHLFDKVNALDGEWRYSSQTETEQIRGELVLLNQVLEMARKYLADWARLGIDQMRIRIDAIKGEQLAQAWARTLERLDLDPDTAERARVVMGEELRRARGE